MNGQFVYIVLIIIIIILAIKVQYLENIVYNGSTEHLTSISDSNNEALQNLATAYNSGSMTVTNLTVTGDATVSGNATVGGLTKLKNTQINGTTTGTGDANFSTITTTGNATIGGTTTSTGKLTVTGGSDFSGPSHLFKDTVNSGTIKIGSFYGNPGISADGGKPLQVQDFTIGVQAASSTNTSDMYPDKNYCYIKSRLPSYALLNNTNTGLFGMGWSNKRLYYTLLNRNARTWNDSDHYFDAAVN